MEANNLNPDQTAPMGKYLQIYAEIFCLSKPVHGLYFPRFNISGGVRQTLVHEIPCLIPITLTILLFLQSQRWTEKINCLL